jgi:curved DNA-binding protein CbpA
MLPPAEEVRRIEKLYDRLKTTDHYTLLGVAATADIKEIKRAYYALAKLHHPDRYFRRDIGGLAAKVEAIFRALTAALETLSDAAARASYDSYLREVLKTRLARRNAEAAETRGDWAAGAESWARVLETLPNDANVNHRFANAHLRALEPDGIAMQAAAKAIALDPTRVEYRLTAASLYLAAGLERNALAEITVACELEPSRADLAGLCAALTMRCGKLV